MGNSPSQKTSGKFIERDSTSNHDRRDADSVDLSFIFGLSGAGALILVSSLIEASLRNNITSLQQFIDIAF
jgi:hypothetical protein